MSSNIFQNFDWLVGLIIFFVILGILLFLSGLRSIRTNSALSIGRNGYFRWKKPKILKGKDAREVGGCTILIGIVIIIYGLFLIYMFVIR
jgi:hypothetical protein